VELKMTHATIAQS